MTSVPAPVLPTRRLAAILLADVAGYSRLMERDEEGTHLRLREIRGQVTDPAVERHRGRIVRTKGDDILVEFASAMDALSCAVDIQRQMGERNRDLARDSRIEFRIGINLGDILIDGSEIAGDGVNVAARLEALAEPGEIAVSRAVREQVRQLVGVRLADAGEHRVKNIKRPIRVYKVELDGQRRTASHLIHRFVLQRAALWAVCLVLALAAALFASRPMWFTHPEPPPSSLIVLPFINQAGVQAQAVTDYLTADLTTALSQALMGAVVSPSVAGGFLEQRDPLAVGRTVNVRYLLDGSVTKSDQQVRVAVRLVSAETGVQLWGSTLEAPQAPTERVPLELIGRIADTASDSVRRAELTRPRRSETRAYELALRARLDLPNTNSVESLEAVRQEFERAVALQPDLVLGLCGLAATLAYQSLEHRSRADIEALLKRADQLTLKALALAGNDAYVWHVRSIVLQFMNRLPAAEEAISRSLTLNPYSSEAHGHRGHVLTSAGRLNDAVAAFDQALRLNPEADTVGVHLFHRARALLFLGRYQEAIDCGLRATAYTPDWLDYMVLTAAYAMKGELLQAQETKAELLRRLPDFTLARAIESAVPVSAATAEQRERHLIEGLRRAGIN